MPQTFPSYAEAKAECPEGWRVDAVVDQFCSASGTVLSYRYFPVPPEADLDEAFEAKHERPMEDMQRFLIAMAISGEA